MDGTDKTYRVVRLLVENYKRLKAADVTPGRNAVIVAGKNKAGKTSLLDAIAAVLGGKKQVAAQPIRKGAESGQIVCVLGGDRGELLVKRLFTPNGKTALEITAEGGFKAPSPQAILDSLCGSIAFDPLAFTRQSDREQAETLRGLVGLDFSSQDAERKQLYEQRTFAHKQAKQYAAQVAGISVPDDTPADEVSAMALMVEQKRRQAHNADNQRERDKIRSCEYAVNSKSQEVANLEGVVEDLEARLARAKKALEAVLTAKQQAQAVLDAQKATVAVLEDQDVDEIQQQIIAAQETNANVAKARQRAELARQRDQAELAGRDLTEKMDAIDAEKSRKLSAVQWPIEGLGFDDSGVTYNGLPFSQASGAEQLAVSFAMSAAAHPRLRVALIRDASLLDEEQMATVCGLAEKYDTQVWLEVVDSSAGPCGILIEDGMVVATKPGRMRQADAAAESQADTTAPPEIDERIDGAAMGEQEDIPY